VHGLGERWEIFRNGIKPYACGVVTHPPIDAVRSLTDRGVRPEDIQRIHLAVHPLVAELTGKTDPRTGLEGKFSVRFACAIVLIDGAARERQFTDANVHREDVRALMARIEVVPDPQVPHEAAVATARLADGRELTVTIAAAKGTPGNRISDTELSEKFHDLVDPVLGAARADILAERVWTIDQADRIDELAAAAVPKAASESGTS
jgi:2-methylcitrate dehydratase PrpD